MNKEEIMKEIEHIANCELYDTIGVKYLRLNIEKLFEENQQLKEVIDKAIEYIESKNNGHCIINGEEKGAFTFVLDFDEAREFIWELLDILKEVK